MRAFVRRWKNLSEETRTFEGRRIWASRANSPEEQRRYVMFVRWRKVLEAAVDGMGLNPVGNPGAGRGHSPLP